MLVQKLCSVGGAILLLVGIVGFLQPNLLGMHLTPVHNVVHIVSGGLGLYFGLSATPVASASFALAFGSVYMFLGLMGVVAPGALARLLGHEGLVTPGTMMMDNIVHLIIGGAFLAVTLWQRQPSLLPRRTV